MIGVLLALGSRRGAFWAREPAWLRERRAAAALLPLLALVPALTTSAIGPWRFSVAAVLGGVLVLVASFDRDYLRPSGLCGQAMLWIGTRSYALYLTHMPAYFAARELWTRTLPPHGVLDVSYTVPVGVTGVLLALLLSELTWRLIEQPCRRHGRSVALRAGERSHRVAAAVGQMARAAARDRRRPLLWGLILLLAWAPFPLGSNRPIPWTLLGLATGLLLLAWSGLAARGEAAALLPWRRIWPALAGFGLVVAVILLQLAPFTPAGWHHPMWLEAQAVLGQAVGGGSRSTPT